MSDKTLRAVALIAGSIGLMFLGGALFIQPDLVGWGSNVGVEVGATLLLFIPLLYLTKRIEGKIQQVEQKATQEIEALSEQVTEVREEIRRTREELSDAVVAELDQARMTDVEVFEKVATEPTKREVAEALERADQLGLITAAGCRVSIYDTDYYLAFRLPEGPWKHVTTLPITTHLESRSGKRLRHVNWQEDESALRFLVKVGEALQSIGKFPGDIAFDSGKIFIDLSELLVVAHRHATGRAGIRNPLGRVYQFCSPQWAITRNAVTKVGEFGESYIIPLSRLGEMDWFDHVQRKSGVDTSSLAAALDDGRAMWKAGVLVPEATYADPLEEE